MVLTLYVFQQCVLYPGCPKRNTKTQTWGEAVPFFCAFTMSWWKLILSLPHNYFVQRQDINVIPKLFALQLRPLWLKENDCRGRVKKNTPWCSLTLLKIQHHASVDDRVLRFSRRAQLPWRAHEVSLYKRPVYMSYCREDIIKKKEWLLSRLYRCSKHTRDDLHLNSSNSKYLCLMTRTEFLQASNLHSPKHSFYELFLKHILLQFLSSSNEKSTMKDSQVLYDTIH